jgi:hypothetical protein
MSQQLSWYKLFSVTPNRSNKVDREEIAATYLRHYLLKQQEEAGLGAAGDSAAFILTQGRSVTGLT